MSKKRRRDRRNMNKDMLEMRYHPAKKEVEFTRFQGSAPVLLPKSSLLRRYMEDEKGKFILQDHGKKFFDDIADAFDGIQEVPIRVVTTKADFIDFQQMVNHYNSSGQAKCRFNVLPGSVESGEEAYLPDMDVICKDVRQHGIDAVNVLKKHNLALLDFPPSKSEYARRSVKTFSESIQKSIENITKNMERFGSNTVNLCFTGVYSAGKSALINALLGYRILPENINSETAKMLQIRSPRFDEGENISISFFIGSKRTELQWNEASQKMEVTDSPIENRLVTEIRTQAAKQKGMPKHQQIYALMKMLNSDADVGSEIHVRFPIPLDTPEVQFSIYDTPGADSNFSAHEEVLKEALNEQTSSILIFVALPKKLEGSGNQKLLTLVKAADTEEHRSPIDINRSLFVINAADTISPRERRELKNSEIGDVKDSTFAIKLANQKLLFTSARYAYAAKAFQNGIIPSGPEDTFDDARYFKKAVEAAEEEGYGRYYKEDRCAFSEYATSNLLSACDAALCKAQEAGDNAEIVHVCSGLYALEYEILQYGKKYAAAVRAYAIINSVDTVLKELNATANSLNNQNLAEINRISANISRLRDEIEDSIAEIVDSFKVDDVDALPKGILVRLSLDTDFTMLRVNSVLDFIHKKIRGFWGRKPKDDHCVAIGKKITDEVQIILSGYSQGIKELLSSTRDNVIKEIKAYIQNNGELTEEAKKFVCDFVSADFSLPITPLEGVRQAYRESIETKLFGLKRVNVEKLGDAVKDEMLAYLSKLLDKLRHQYKNNLEETLALVQQQVTERLDQYSVLLKGMLEDKESMEQLGNQIQSIECELQACQERLDKSIWKEEKQ